jgi:DNA-binding transcriptional LysR family regulator
MLKPDTINMNGIELRHLRYFIAVAEELHFSRAAERLHMAQPPLSQQIRYLEEWIGYPLFIRTSRNVRLTPAGKELLQRVLQTMRKLESDVLSAKQVGRGETGNLMVGFVGSSMLTSLPKLIKHYRTQYPEVHLRLEEFYTSTLVQALQEETVDVGFLRDAELAEGLHIEKLFQERFVAIVPASHRLAQKKSIAIPSLRSEPFVLFRRAAGEGAWRKTVSICEQHGFLPNIVQEAPHWLTIVRLVGAAIGITLAPECVREIASRDVVCLPLQNVQARSNIELGYKEQSVSCAILNGLLRLTRAFAAV